MSKQTAVDYLFEKLCGENGYVDIYYMDVVNKIQVIYDEAKAMEKQQSITDYCEGFKASGEGWNGEYGLDNILDVAGEIDAEQYYDITYKGGEQ